jgi:quercetin dioxygenase-like cupin family protein
MADEPASGADILRNPFTDQTIRFVSESEELLVMESSYAAGGAPAPAHLHPAQEERFTVLTGAVRARVNGQERILREGDELVIEAGTAHEFGGHPDEPGTVRWEVRPALRTREFFEGLFAALAATAEAQRTESTPEITFDPASFDDVFKVA